MELLELSKSDRRSVEIGVVGPEGGRPVLYFHSPSTSGEELALAEDAATQLGMRLFCVRRPSIKCDRPEEFVSTVAGVTVDAVEELGLERVALLAWSGGAPYALAAAIRLGPAAASIHLVSPVPGPLSGANALTDLSPRLADVANTNADSPWISGPAVLRDYLAVAAPWTFDVGTVLHPPTIWAPADDETVPTRLAAHLAGQLLDSRLIEVDGNHDWFLENWASVLGQIVG